MKPKFIAEIGSNHNGSLDRALALVDAAAEAGCWAVKTQTWKVEQMFAPEALQSHPDLLARKGLEVPQQWHAAIAERAREHGLKYGSAVCHRDGLFELIGYADFLKIGSYELLHRKLLREAAETGLPLIVSTGMSSMEECLDARQILMEAGAWSIVFLHCVSQYPAIGELNLKAIDSMQKQICWPIGWSDHTTQIESVDRAVQRWRASYVELHLDLEDGAGIEAPHSWTPQRTKALIDGAGAMPSTLRREDPILDGDGIKRCLDSELEERSWRADPKDGMRPMRAKRAELETSIDDLDLSRSPSL